MSFSDKATKAKVTRSPCFTEQLGLATTDNTKSIISYINSLSFNGGTNYENALRASFEYFKSSEVSLQGEERGKYYKTCVKFAAPDGHFLIITYKEKMGNI